MQKFSNPTTKGTNYLMLALMGRKLIHLRHSKIKDNHETIKCFRCKRPVCYTCQGSSKEDTFTMNGFKYSLVRHVSFVDCPGHDILMATMLNGAAVMDAALLLIGKKIWDIGK